MMPDTVKLHSTRMASHTWTPHGLSYPIRFDDSGDATMSLTDYDAWVGDATAFSMGLEVEHPKDRPPKPEKPKPKPKPKAKAKKKK